MCEAYTQISIMKRWRPKWIFLPVFYTLNCTPQKTLRQINFSIFHHFSNLKTIGVKNIKAFSNSHREQQIRYPDVQLINIKDLQNAKFATASNQNS